MLVPYNSGIIKCQIRVIEDRHGRRYGVRYSRCRSTLNVCFSRALEKAHYDCGVWSDARQEVAWTRTEMRRTSAVILRKARKISYGVLPRNLLPGDIKQSRLLISTVIANS